MRFNEIDIDNLKEAFRNTCQYRGFFFSKEEAMSVIKNIVSSKAILARWASYCKKNQFARDVSFIEVMVVVEKIVDLL